jgi:hypothetical protein
MDYDQATRILRALEENRVRYAIFGGAALNFHGIARFTVLRERFNLKED